MRNRQRKSRDSGQSIIETLLTLPFLLTVLLNAVNFGYFYFVALHLAASPRAAVEYSIIGRSTPAAISYAQAGPISAALSVSHVAVQDLTGSIYAPSTNVAVQVCSMSNGIVGSGTANERAACTTHGTVPAGYSFPAVQPDPELNPAGTPAFISNRVDVVYTFQPLIPGAPFNLALLASPACNATNGVTCIMHRPAIMRAM